MSLDIGMQAQIRSMIFVAGEPIPFFWPMRAFIHHNPLHGLEKLSFEEAVNVGRRLFHGKGFLPGSTYRRYLDEGRIDPQLLEDGVQSFMDEHGAVDGVDLHAWLMSLLTGSDHGLGTDNGIATVDDIRAALRHDSLPAMQDADIDPLADRMRAALPAECPLYEALDLLFGTGIGEELDELVIKSCLDFFDEGQSVWQMPDREKGFFSAWREVARRNARLFARSGQERRVL